MRLKVNIFLRCLVAVGLVAVGGVDVLSQQDDDLQLLSRGAAPVSLAVQDADVSVLLET